MPSRKTRIAMIALVLAATVFGASGVPAHALTAAQQAAKDRAVLQRASERLEAARSRSASIRRRAQAASSRLDGIIAEQDETSTRLNARARSMYRNGDSGFISLLLGADTFEEFATRWDLLTRMNEVDASDLERLAKLRREAKSEAGELLKLQEQEARSVAEEASEVAKARKQLAASRAALAAYDARVASASSSSRSESATTKPKKDKTQELKGSGAWKTAVASHYSRTFTGRGASGARIGPYSMMVAHKKLPFGTLIEFEYKGRRAVAKVADRGPYTAGRTFDLGPGIVRALNFSGVHKVKYRVIGR